MFSGDFMKIIICLDESSAMMFNNRRQSRDSVVIADLISTFNGEKIIISDFSKGLFNENTENVVVLSDENFKSELYKGNQGVYFAENTDIAQFLEAITEITVYYWNRAYPGDMFCTVDFSKFTIKSEEELPGSSHEKITKVVYVK